MYIGIDLGTTNTLVAVYNQQHNGYELCPFYYGEGDPGNGSVIMPSVLYRESEDAEILVGLPARRRADGRRDYSRGHYFHNTKAYLEEYQTQPRPGQAETVNAEFVAEKLLTVCFCSVLKYIEAKQSSTGRSSWTPEKKLGTNCRIGISVPLATNPEFSRKIREAAFRAADQAQLQYVGRDGTVQTWRIEHTWMDNAIQIYEEPLAAMQSFVLRERRREAARLPKQAGLDACAPPMPVISTSPDSPQIAMVVDLGGGTSDIAIRPFYVDASPYRGSPKNRIEFLSEARAASGRVVCQADNPRPDFGGMDFDERNEKYLLYLLNRAYAATGRAPFCEAEDCESSLDFDGSIDFFDDQPEKLRGRVSSYAYKLAQEMKQYFAGSNPGSFSPPTIRNLLSEEDESELRISVGQEEYSDLVRALIEQGCAERVALGHEAVSLQRIIEETMKRAGLTDLADLSFVYLTGGMSNVREIRDWLVQYVDGSCPILWADQEAAPDESAGQETSSNCLTDIAKGIAFLANRPGPAPRPEYVSLSNDVLVDVQGMPRVLIPNGARCPGEGNGLFEVPVESVVGIPVRLYSGKTAYDSQLKEIGCHRLARNQIIPIGTKLHFHYYLDKFKQIRLTAVYQDENGVEHSEELKDLNRIDD